MDTLTLTGQDLTLALTRNLPPCTNGLKDYKEYYEYVDASLSKIREHVEAVQCFPVDVEAYKLINELRLWAFSGAVWPRIIHDYAGSLVLHWAANGLHLRAERNSSGMYELSAWWDGPEAFNAELSLDRLGVLFYILCQSTRHDWKFMLWDLVENGSLAFSPFA